MTQNLKRKAYLKQNVMELDMRKFTDPKTLTFGVWGLETSLGQFGPKAFGRGLIKPLVKNTGSIFTNRTSFFKNHGLNKMKLCNHKNVLTLGPGA